MIGQQTIEVSFDGTYDHRNNHASRITGVAINVKTGTVLWRLHLHRDLGTGLLTNDVEFRDYQGTAHTAEADILVIMFEEFKDEGIPISHITIDGDQQ